jgi:heme ABC exporter ATP-binding subunit CcmA
MAVTLDRITRRFGPVTALADVALTIGSGELVVLLGPNGAGKSTLLRLAAGIVRPTAGTVRFGDEDPRRTTGTAARVHIGYLGHRSLLHEHLTAHENLALYAALYGRRRDADTLATRWLGRVGLARAADRVIRGFSRGMMQRLALARALLHGPRLLLLDEPSSGLDTDGRALLFALLDEQHRRGVTVMTASHHLELLEPLADRVVVLRRGRLVEQDAAAVHSADEWVRRAAGRGAA